MIKFWPTTPTEPLTPKADSSRDGQDSFFNSTTVNTGNTTTTSTGHQTPPSYHHHLLYTPALYNSSTSSTCSRGSADHTPTNPLTPGGFNIASALPTTQLSLHVHEFNMRAPPLRNPPDTNADTSSSSSTSSSAGSPTPPAAKGQIHVKLISARGLSVRSIYALPYVVVQFEQNEFISRKPTGESVKDSANGTPTSNVSRNSSSNALSALGAIAAKRGLGGTGISPPPSSLSSAKSPPTPQTLFGPNSAHNPVWKHEVSFDVTSEKSSITFTVYDGAIEEHVFLGTVQIKPVLIHDHTVDQWYKLKPLENEVVTGEMRVQITYDQYRIKRALTPRDFEFLKLIGRGTFGKVFQVRKKDTRRIYAMKVLSKKEIVAKKEVAHTIGERKILQRSVESSFLVGLKFSFQTETDLYLVTDFKSGGELFWHLQKETRFSEERARFYVAELILALEHLHKYDIVYRDLKPENILLDATGHVALCDFGLSKANLRADELTTTFCGTTEYLAPEVLLDEHGYSKLVDFWSLGVLLFEMCCGWSPFYAEDLQQMYKNICFGKIRFPKGVINEDGKQFVKALLNRNPRHRLGAQRDTQELKEHPFFESLDWVALSMKRVTPPFKPVVESDESTSNFDPQFTSADIREVGFAEMDMDEDDPSEDWTTQSMTSSFMHTPNGPLGSDRIGNGSHRLSQTTKRHAIPGPLSDLKGPTPRPQGIQVPKKKRKDFVVGTPLTSSVQENFRGFTFHGRESLIPPHLLKDDRGEDEEAVDIEDDQELNTDDEYADDRAAGRYAYARRKGQKLDDDEMRIH